MKWFKHQSDSYSNLKHQQLLAEHGLEGYGFFWICVELVAQQGSNSRIKGEKSWKKVLTHVTHTSTEKMEAFLNCFAEVNLIDKKGLEIGDLYIPKLKDYGDEYTDKVRRMSRQSRDNVGLDKNRIEENRIEIQVETSPKFEAIDLELSSLLRDLILANTPTFKPPDLRKWAAAVRLMRERDGRTPEQIKYVIEWCQKDNFWKANILSTQKLREKFDQLVSQVKRQVDKNKIKSSNVAFT